MGGGHRGSVRDSHPEARGLNLGTPDFLTIEASSVAVLLESCLYGGRHSYWLNITLKLKRYAVLSSAKQCQSFIVDQNGREGKARSQSS